MNSKKWSRKWWNVLKIAWKAMKSSKNVWKLWNLMKHNLNKLGKCQNGDSTNGCPNFHQKLMMWWILSNSGQVPRSSPKFPEVTLTKLTHFVSFGAVSPKFPEVPRSSPKFVQPKSLFWIQNLLTFWSIFFYNKFHSFCHFWSILIKFVYFSSFLVIFQRFRSFLVNFA